MHKAAKVLMLLWTIFCVIGVIVGLANVSSTPQGDQYQQAGAAIGTALGLGFWAMIWFFPTVGLGIIALVTRPKERPVEVLEKPTLCPSCGKYYTGSPKHCPNCGQLVGQAVTAGR